MQHLKATLQEDEILFHYLFFALLYVLEIWGMYLITSIKKKTWWSKGTFLWWLHIYLERFPLILFILAYAPIIDNVEDNQRAKVMCVASTILCCHHPHSETLLFPSLVSYAHLGARPQDSSERGHTALPGPQQSQQYLCRWGVTFISALCQYWDSRPFVQTACMGGEGGAIDQLERKGAIFPYPPN